MKQIFLLTGATALLALAAGVASASAAPIGTSLNGIAEHGRLIQNAHYDDDDWRGSGRRAWSWRHHRRDDDNRFWWRHRHRSDRDDDRRHVSRDRDDRGARDERRWR